jgi:hypothetical protein
MVDKRPYLTDDERLKIKTKQEVRRWLVHGVVFLAVQIPLIPSGYSIFNPLVHLFGGPDRQYDLAYRLTEGWTFLLLLDALVVASWPAWPKVRDFLMDR